MIKTLTFPPEIYKMKMEENKNRIVMLYPDKLGHPGDRLRISNDNSAWQIEKIHEKNCPTILAGTWDLEAGFTDPACFFNILKAVYGTLLTGYNGRKFKWPPDLYPHILTRINANTPEINFSLTQWGIK